MVAVRAQVPGEHPLGRPAYLRLARVVRRRHPEVRAEHGDDGRPLPRVVLTEPLQGVQAAQADGRVVAAEQLDGAGVQLGQPALGGVVVGRPGLPLLVALRRVGDGLGVRLDAFAVRLVLGGDGLLVALRAFADPLPAGSEQQREATAGAGDHGQPGADGVDAQGGPGVRLGGPVGLAEQPVQHPPAEGDGEQQPDQHQPPRHHPQPFVGWWGHGHSMPPGRHRVGDRADTVAA
ncbi:hypothetical protein ACN26Y_16815 [Micromonospora sp. WMMD558]|uniref:hypothetical protein n=1 Tax=Micromonospora sp. WMMD558 TaxID=3403462 RepID=UPI003BF4DE25